MSITVDDVLPSAPRDVVLTTGDAQIRVAWTEPDSNGGASIDGYRVRHRARVTPAAEWNYSAPLTASPYVITRLTNGTTYRVEVQARNSLQPPEFGHWAMVDPVTPLESTLPVVDAPATPTKTGATSSSITVSWAAVTGAAKYQVRYKTGTNDWNTVEVAAGTRYKAEMLDATTTYRFEVSAYGDGTTFRTDWGAWSMHLDAATNAAPTVSGCTTTLGSISGESSYEGTWTDECVSSNRPSTRYARYFTLELATAAELTIELMSETDPYLYLMEGAGPSGTELAKNDDKPRLRFRIPQLQDHVRGRRKDLHRRSHDLQFEAHRRLQTHHQGRHRAGRYPRNVRLAHGDRQIAVTWDSPDDNGGAVITGYRIRHRSVANRAQRAVTDPSINWSLGIWQAASGGTASTIENLDVGTYAVEVQARNNNNDPDREGAWSAHIRRVAATDGGLARLVANPGGKRNRYDPPVVFDQARSFSPLGVLQVLQYPFLVPPSELAFLEHVGPTGRIPKSVGPYHVPGR